MTISRQWHH